ncbi:co-chaperonin GroES [Pectobacterium phage vB_PcaM_CBB]|uniref:Co-chaperonin GroES n=1 Tax=Pectobacterium phage vB_PcaM_CBB TaxID=2772511 RepID=A0A1L2CUY1_9CAUD|nr:co-chaperonin GroES [Pectobacterium phage vB_PcaM_CBB]AMM43832.1 co-chaperonin GroES [Pectobacterium phage vB_PcaM_CBB]
MESNMSLQAINDYVIVELIDNTKQSSAGLILTSVEPPCTGTVITVGPGRVLNDGSREEHNIQVGDVIVFGKSSLNMPLEDDDKTFYVMKTSDIFGKKNG